MVIQITENRQVNGRWFLAPQQYAWIASRVIPGTRGEGVSVYDILVDTVTYTIPTEIAALIDIETPSTDMRGAIERWESERTKDIAAPVTGGHTDVVKQAEIFLGIHTTNRVQVDGERLRQLKEQKHANN